VTTIPAAANIGVAGAYEDWSTCAGSLEQLAINLGAIVLSGTTVLALQRLLYLRRKHDHSAVTPSPATTRSRPWSGSSRSPRR
jgi:hypothetical protein